MVTQDNHKQRTATVAWNSEIAYSRRQWNNWIYRISTEIKLAQRTWFVTLTFRNSDMRGLEQLALEKYLGLCEQLKLSTQPTPVNIKQAKLLLARNSVRQWLKKTRRVHKDLRYICVTEYGGLNGRLHFHLLLHFTTDVPWTALNTWTHGFQNIKLCQTTDFHYVAKYITKQEQRILCSSKYGSKILQYLLSMQKYKLLLETNPRKFYKLTRRLSSSQRFPTKTYILSLMPLLTPSTKALF